MTGSEISNPFTDSDVQLMLRDSLQRLLDRHYSAHSRETIAAGKEGWSREIWQEFADLGVLALAVPEASGGICAATRDLWAATETMGRSLVVEPYTETAVAAAALIDQLDLGAAGGERLQAIFEGRSISVLAGGVVPDDAANGEPAGVTAEPVGDGFVLHGTSSFVAGAPCADDLLVLAALEGETAIFLVEPAAAGVGLRPFRTLDGRPCAHIDFDAVAVVHAALLGRGDAAERALRHAAMLRLVAHGGEATGLMRAAVDASVEHARTREQFGQPIGRFQALQHRLVDMHVAQREVSALGEALAFAVDTLGSDHHETARWAAAMRQRLATSGQAVGEGAIQIHGGMGMSEELPVGAMLRRLRAIAIQEGGRSRALDDFRALA